jgi:hypothetical protein
LTLSNLPAIFQHPSAWKLPSASPLHGPRQRDGRAGAVLDRLLVLEVEVIVEAVRELRCQVLALHKARELLQLPPVRLGHRILVHHVVEQRAEDEALQPD